MPARAGSKGLPHKNMAPVGGRPMVEWTFDAALEAPEVDLVVATTDDPALASLAQYRGVEVLDRPAELASDRTTAAEVVKHVLGYYDHEVVIYLQPTSPRRTHLHVSTALALLFEPGTEAVVSVAEQAHPVEWTMRIDHASGLLRTLDGASIPPRRQDADKCYLLNGAIYCARRVDLLPHGDFLSLRLKPLLMDRIDSVDVDDQADLAFANYLMSRGSIR